MRSCLSLFLLLFESTQMRVLGRSTSREGGAHGKAVPWESARLAAVMKVLSD